MKERSNQHFVPQFYFRQFTAGGRGIHVLLTSNGRIVLNASIRGQCARQGFYGPSDLEALFSKLEQAHSVSLRYFIGLAWSERPGRLEPKVLASMLEAVLFQRARTELEVEKHAPATEALMLEMFRHHVAHSPGVENREAILAAIDQGCLRITENRTAKVLQQIAMAMESVVLISDLDFCVLRNLTEYPFIFGDSPVIYCNTYYRNVTRRGVLGLQTPGLQIFMPLDSRTLLMLLDSAVYGTPTERSPVVDVCQPFDVDQLNALQLHHSLNAVYFGDKRAAEYVAALWRAHRPFVVKPKSSFKERKGWLLDGKPTEGILQVFEKQLNIGLQLSFIRCTPIQEAEFKFRRRSPELYAEHKKRYPDWYPNGGRNA